MCVTCHLLGVPLRSSSPIGTDDDTPPFFSLLRNFAARRTLLSRRTLVSQGFVCRSAFLTFEVLFVEICLCSLIDMMMCTSGIKMTESFVQNCRVKLRSCIYRFTLQFQYVIGSCTTIVVLYFHTVADIRNVTPVLQILGSSSRDCRSQHLGARVPTLMPLEWRDLA